MTSMYKEGENKQKKKGKKISVNNMTAVIEGRLFMMTYLDIQQQQPQQ